MLRCALLLGSSWWLVMLGAVAAGQDPVHPTGAALATIFSPDRAPANRTMGLVQRNFLDLVEEAQPKLQVALVIDGTSSMTDSLVAVKATIGQMMEDLALYKQAEVGYQLVIVRDEGAESGAVSFPLKAAGKAFTADREALLRALAAVQPETGAPYFYEPLDLAMQKTIADLEWAKDEATSRWMLVIGDAPPFEKGFQESDTGARRHVDEERLAAMATARGIRVSCILVGSRPEEREIHEQVLAQARAFMASVSSATGGLLLDLSYPDIRQALLSAAKQPRVKHTPIGTIDQAEIEALRATAEQEASALANSKQAKLAVLPHRELTDMTFRADVPEVRLATDLRRRLREIPGVEVKSARIVKAQFERLARLDLPQNQFLQMLASRLGVDYLVWGSMSDSAGVIELASTIYRQSDGRPVGTGKGSRESLSAATNMLVRDVVNSTVSKRDDVRLASVFGSLRNDPEGQQQVVTPVSSVTEAVDPLLEAYEELEQTLAIDAQDENAPSRLGRVRGKLQRVVELDAANPIAHQLLASCLFGEAQIAERAGDEGGAAQGFAQAKAALVRAKRVRNHPALTRALRLEIAGDYELLAQRNVVAAVAAYEALADVPAEGEGKLHLHAALRAHWMLAGIRCGDWGAAKTPEVLDAAKARDHLTAILAFWPDSPEANYIRTKLRWNTEKAENAFAHYPHQGPAFLDTLE